MGRNNNAMDEEGKNTQNLHDTSRMKLCPKIACSCQIPIQDQSPSDVRSKPLEENNSAGAH